MSCDEYKSHTHRFSRNFLWNSLKTPVLSSSWIYLKRPWAPVAGKFDFATPKSICKSMTSRRVKRTRAAPKPTATRSLSFIERSKYIFISREYFKNLLNFATVCSPKKMRINDDSSNADGADDAIGTRISLSFTVISSLDDASFNFTRLTRLTRTINSSSLREHWWMQFKCRAQRESTMYAMRLSLTKWSSQLNDEAVVVVVDVGHAAAFIQLVLRCWWWWWSTLLKFSFSLSKLLFLCLTM